MNGTKAYLMGEGLWSIFANFVCQHLCVCVSDRERLREGKREGESREGCAGKVVRKKRRLLA